LLFISFFRISETIKKTGAVSTLFGVIKKTDKKFFFNLPQQFTLGKMQEIELYFFLRSKTGNFAIIK
jgi:hypothetical protein